MTAQRGDDVRLYLGDGEAPEHFTELGGVQRTAFAFASQPVNAAHLASGGWQALLEQAGHRSLHIQASGRFTDSATETTLRQTAFSQSLRNYQLRFGNGDTLQGRFKITHYARSGTYGSEETYELSLESAGEVTYLPSA